MSQVPHHGVRSRARRPLGLLRPRPWTSFLEKKPSEQLAAMVRLGRCASGRHPLPGQAPALLPPRPPISSTSYELLSARSRVSLHGVSKICEAQCMLQGAA